MVICGDIGVLVSKYCGRTPDYPCLDPNPDRFWTFDFEAKRLAWWVSGQKLRLGSQKLGQIWTRYGLDRFFFLDTTPAAPESLEIVAIDVKICTSMRLLCIWAKFVGPIIIRKIPFWEGVSPERPQKTRNFDLSESLWSKGPVVAFISSVGNLVPLPVSECSYVCTSSWQQTVVCCSRDTAVIIFWHTLAISDHSGGNVTL